MFHCAKTDVFYWLCHNSKSTLDTQLNFYKKTMYFAFAIKPIHKLFSCDYLSGKYSMVKCHRNANFEEIDTELSAEKNDEF